MGLPALVWWIGGPVLGLVGIGVTAEIIHKRNVAKALAATNATKAGIAAGNANVTPASQAAAASPGAQAGLAAGAASQGATPAQVQAAAQALGGDANQILAAQLAANPNTDPAVVAADVARNLLASAASLQQSGAANPAAVQQAIVHTNDPPPSGDLIIRSGPSTSSPQIGGAEKNGIVTVLDSGQVTADFTKISWPGGNRLPACDGFAHTSALQLI